jgi:sterol desaturase/sphingolipid hydroxylase (fatty acid hydroxylase superfamily)
MVNMIFEGWNKCISFYISMNLTYWLTCLYCYPADDKAMVKMALPRVFLNMFFVSIPAFVPINYLITERDFELYYFVRDITVYFLTIDFWLYCTHYLFHTRQLYKYHKVHHEFTVPSSVTALYTHWLDFYFNNLFPVLIMPIMLQSDPLTVLVWIVYTTFNAVYMSHSRITPDTSHLIHHKYFVYNYGVNVYMDRLFGTHKPEL